MDWWATSCSPRIQGHQDPNGQRDQFQLSLHQTGGAAHANESRDATKVLFTQIIMSLTYFLIWFRRDLSHQQHCRFALRQKTISFYPQTRGVFYSQSQIHVFLWGGPFRFLQLSCSQTFSCTLMSIVWRRSSSKAMESVWQSSLPKKVLFSKNSSDPYVLFGGLPARVDMIPEWQT